MTISTKTKVRFALLTSVATAATAALIVACGNGDDDDTSTPKTDSGTKLDSTTPTTDSGGGGGQEASTPVDSGIVDAAPDAADAAAPPVSCAGYLYCDDFESYPDSGTIANNTKLGPWTTGVGGKTDAGQTLAMGVDTVRPFSGSYALHLTAPAGESTYGQLQRAAGGDAGDIGGNLYGRAMVYFSNAPLPGGSAPLTDASTYGLPTGVHSWLFASSGHSPELDAAVSANIIVGNPKFALNYSPGDYGPNATPDAGPVSTGSWHCLQWQYDGSDASPDDVMNVWFDGLQVVHTDRSLEYSNDNFPVKTWLKMASDWNSLTFGFTHYQTMANPVDVYLDDFAVNDQMVPCPTTP